jgi:hypothetical protein
MVYVARMGTEEREARSIEEFAAVLDAAFGAGHEASPEVRAADGRTRPLSCAETVRLLDLYAARAA